MSEFSVDLNALGQVPTSMSSISSGLTNVQSSLNTIRQEVSRSLSIPIALLNLMPDVIQKHLMDMQVMDNALREIIELYKQAENTIRDNANNGGTSGNGSSQTEPVDPTANMTYDEILEYRAENAVDENSARLYERYRDRINIADDSYDGTAHYSRDTESIYYNAENDATNERGAGNTYYHEVGHFIDDQSDFFGYTSTNGRYDFYDCLQDDVNNWLQNYMTEHGCSIDDAYDALSDWLYTDPNMKNGISDIICGITNDRASGRWSHADSYYNDASISKEAFAHFFEASMASDPTKLDYIREMFPTAYAEYQQMIQDELNS